MKNQIDLERIERNAFRDTLLDGLVETLAGVVLLIAALAQIHVSFIAFLGLVPIFFSRLLERLRERHTYPRLGYVAFPVEDPKLLLRGMLAFALLVIGLLALGLLLYGNIGEADQWYRWMPAAAGTLLTGGFIYVASRSRLVRFYVYTVLSIATGLLYAALEVGSWREGTALQLLTMAAMVGLTGLVTFRRFIRNYPILEPQGNDAPQMQTSPRI